MNSRLSLGDRVLLAQPGGCAAGGSRLKAGELRPPCRQADGLGELSDLRVSLKTPNIELAAPPSLLPSLHPLSHQPLYSGASPLLLLALTLKFCLGTSPQMPV